MKYNTIIIGGGLSGLVAGIELATRQQGVAIISNGQSALHFSSGSFGLLGHDSEGSDVDNPLQAIAQLPASHPYSRIGADRVAELAAGVPDFFAKAGVTLKGSASKNHLRMSPFGKCSPSWLTLSDFVTCDDTTDIKNVAIVNIKGYLDFYPAYIADGLAAKGIESAQYTVTTDELDRLRKSSTEMRASSIARRLTGHELSLFAAEINRVAKGVDAVIIPAVIGFDSEEPLVKFREMVNAPLYCVATTPMSVTGLRTQMMLRERFEQLGGTYLLGDNVVEGNFDTDGRLISVKTVNFGNDLLEADNFILATGGIFSRGLVADPSRIYEPMFNLDVDAPADRQQWYSKNFFDRQPYMSYGVVTDGEFHPSRDGKTVPNLYAAGAILSGYDALTEESGAGVAITTALHVAHKITDIR